MTGLVGGVAAGKSTVARELALRGARRIDADAIAHEILRDPDVVSALTDRFGDAIRSRDGEIDRRALGRLVFADPDDLTFIEKLTHPRVRSRILRMLGETPPGAVVVLDAALLLENGLDAVCDLIVMVDTPAESRNERASTDRGWEADEVERRERHQWTVAAKRARADVVLVNDGSLEDLRRDVDTLWARLTALAGRVTDPRRQA